MNRLKILPFLAKVFVAGSVLSLFFSAPAFVAGLTDREYLVWLSRVLWVLILSLGCAAAALLGGWLRHGRPRRPPTPSGRPHR